MISPDEQKALNDAAQKIPQDDPGAHNNLAIIYYNKGLYTEAIKALERALQLDPNFVLARNNLEIIMRKTGRLEDKVEGLLKDIERDPHDEQKILDLADTYVKLHKYSHAIVYYKKVLDANPQSYEAHFGFSNTLKFLGKYDDAIEEMDQCLKIRRSREGFHALGEIHLRKGAIDAAIKNLEEALKQDDTSAETHFLLGFALAEKGRTEESVEAVKRAIALNPSLAQGDTQGAAGIADERGQWESLKERLGIQKTSEDACSMHYSMGMSHRNKGAFDQAQQEFSECLKLNEGHADAHYGLAESALFSGRPDQAVSHLELAQDAGYDRLKSTNAVGVAYLLQGMVGEAVASFEEVLRQRTNEPAALNNLGVAQYTLGEIDKAIDNYEKAREAGNADGRYNLAMHHLKSGDHDKAIALLDYDRADALFGRGLVYMEQAEDQKALDAFKGVLDSIPRHAGAYYNMGFIATRLGKYEESLAHIRKGMEIEPNYENIRYHLTLDTAISEFGPYYAPKTQAQAADAFDRTVKSLIPRDPDRLMARAEEYIAGNKIEDALHEIEEALQINPALSRAVVLKADILYHHGNADAAVGLLTEYQQKQPHDVPTLAALATMFKTSGQLEESKAKYQRLADLEPDNTTWVNEAAELAYSLGEEDEALDCYLRVLEKDRESIAAHLRLFRIYLNRNDLTQARKFMEFLADRHPDNYEYNILAGIYWSENHEFEKAEEHFARAAEIDPSEPLPYYHRGLLSVHRGAFKAACEGWKKALLLSPPEDLANRISHCLKLATDLMDVLDRDMKTRREDG